MVIEITDDFNLDKIINSGQCFRPCKISNNTYLFILNNKILEIKKLNHNKFKVSCSENDWENIWFKYFDFGKDYETIRIVESTKDKFAAKAIEYSKGIRILKQDPWETLISFIISQNKNIPAIRNLIEILSREYGHLLDSKRDIYSFPNAFDLKEITEDKLRDFRFGYRAPYLKDAINKVNNNEINLRNLYKLSNEELVTELKKIKGVGDKVAHCVSLFAYSRTDLVPIDIWINRCIKENYDGVSPFEKFGNNAGIIQQYIFYYCRKNKKNP